MKRKTKKKLLEKSDANTIYVNHLKDSLSKWKKVCGTLFSILVGISFILHYNSSEDTNGTFWKGMYEERTKECIIKLNQKETDYIDLIDYINRIEKERVVYMESNCQDVIDECKAIIDIFRRKYEETSMSNLKPF